MGISKSAGIGAAGLGIGTPSGVLSADPVERSAPPGYFEGLGVRREAELIACPPAADHMTSAPRQRGGGRLESVDKPITVAVMVRRSTARGGAAADMGIAGGTGGPALPRGEL
ncbi:MAG: hypothetical protein ACLS63_04515 [Flavonifractor plautii]